MTRIKVVCAEPGAFHDRFGRTVVASFTRTAYNPLDRWQEEKLERDAARYRRHPGALLGLDHADVVGGIKRSRVTRMSRGKPASIRGVTSPHVDLRCRGCGLSRREPGEKLWRVFDSLVAEGRSRVELREVIARLSDAPSG